MSNFDKNRFASNNQEYATPWPLFNKINNIYHFDLDVCADEFNHKCEKYFTVADNALTKDWADINVG